MAGADAAHYIASIVFLLQTPPCAHALHAEINALRFGLAGGLLENRYFSNSLFLKHIILFGFIVIKSAIKVYT